MCYNANSTVAGGTAMFIIIGLLVQALIIWLASVFAGLEYADFWRSVTVALVAWIVGIFLLPFLIVSLLAGGFLGIVLSTVLAALAVWVATKIVMMTDWKLAGQIAVWYFFLTLIYRWAMFAIMGGGRFI